MDLRQLSALLAIADHGSFSAAARSLFTVQSNVSGHIARLERELGATLVDRHRGELTEEGAAVVERARRIRRELDAIAADMASRGTDAAGDARLGVIGTTGRWLMPRLLTTLARTHPRVHTLVIEGTTSSLLPRLVSGHLDAAITHLPVDDPELRVEPLFAEDLVVLVNNHHPLSDHDELPLKAVAAYELLLPTPGTALRRIIDRAALNAGVALRALAEIDGVRLLASLALDGYGATIVPATAVPRWSTGDFHRVHVPELPKRVVGVTYRRRPSLAPPARAVLEALRDTMASLGERQPGVHVEQVSPLTGR
jgi:molybdate transport repressor ModE-like protein